MKRSIFYMKISPDDHCMTTSGLEFRSFFDAIPIKPANLLLLDSNFYDAKVDPGNGMEYVDPQNFPSLYNDNVYDYGDFSWVDYESDEDRAALTPQELAELLYLARFKKPLHSPFFPSLSNKYAYLTHDDGYFGKLYMRDLCDASHLVEHIVLDQLKGRKRSIAPFPADISERIHKACLLGVLFDFDRASFSGVSYYIVNEIGNADDMHRNLDRLRAKINPIGGRLCYNTRKKSWEIYRERRAE